MEALLQRQKATQAKEIELMVKKVLEKNNETLASTISSSLSAKIIELVVKVDKVESRVQALEKSEKINCAKKNFVVFGIPVKDKSNIDKDLQQLWSILKIDPIEYDEAFRKGKEKDGPIVVRCFKTKDKSLVFAKKTLLKGTKIFIHHELSYEERNQEKILREKIKQLHLLDNNITGYVSNGHLRLFRNKKRLEQEEVRNLISLK